MYIYLCVSEFNPLRHIEHVAIRFKGIVALHFYDNSWHCGIYYGQERNCRDFLFSEPPPVLNLKKILFMGKLLKIIIKSKHRCSEYCFNQC